MTEKNDRPVENTGHDQKRPYEPPRIAWEEEYKPTAFGISCAKEFGNPGCAPGPISI